VVDHALDLVVAEAAARPDLDLLLLAGAEVLRRHVEDAVGVDVEADLDLRDAARGRRDPRQLELAQRLVVGRHLALALQDVDLDRRLVVLGRREDLALARRDRGVALDELGHDAALRLDAQRQRGHVEQEHVLDVAGEHSRPDVRRDMSRALASPGGPPAWMAAPTATTSSGLTPRCGSFPVSSLTFSWTDGMRVMPPTRTTWSMPVPPSVPASSSACLVGPTTRSSSSAVSSFSFERVSRWLRCFGTESTAVMNGRLIWVSCAELSSVLAFSASWCRACRAILSAAR